LEGDEQQVALRAHLDPELANELLALVESMRKGQAPPRELVGSEPPLAPADECRDNNWGNAGPKWWLPFDSEAEFKKAFDQLPAEQQRRVQMEPLRKRARFLKFVYRVSAKGPVYENCTILAPDGQILCTVDRKKLNWYVRRGLADYVNEEQTEIKLRFEPKGRFGIVNGQEGIGDEPAHVDSTDTEMQQREHFYTTFKLNRCVVCGAEKNLARYNLVPSCYRAFLPAVRQPGSHDVLLLCIPCHHRATREHGESLKASVADRFGLPFVRPTQQGDPRIAARCSALGLLKGGDLVPANRVEAVFSRIAATFGDADGLQAVAEEVAANGMEFQTFVLDVTNSSPRLSAELLRCTGSALEIMWCAKNYRRDEEFVAKRREKWEQQVGEQVVRSWPEKFGDISGLIHECRSQFVSALRPQFLPDHWDVRHRVSGRRSD